MGGKKKTKWRKLPLEEFIKEPSTKTANVPPEETWQSDVMNEESSNSPSCNETAENVQYYSEPYECIDGLYYPTSCVMYNPADVGMYSNYMMPVDTCYYYYTVPEMSQMQEYVPMPYPEYTAPVPKDTVYLLLPTQALRPSQATPNVVPEWQNRRRRRRYEGYAEYAVIPEKNNSTKLDEKEPGKKTGHYVNSRRNSSQSSSFKKMTSFSETTHFEDFNSVPDRHQGYSKSNEVKKSSFSNLKNENGPSSVYNEMNIPTENYQKRKKSSEMCGIHRNTSVERNELQPIENRNCNTLVSENDSKITLHKSNTENKQKTISDDVSQSPLFCNPGHNLQEIHIINNETKDVDENKTKEQTNNMADKDLPSKELNTYFTSDLYSEVKKKVEPTVSSDDEISQCFPIDTTVTSGMQTEKYTKETHTQSPLPDILSTLNKPLSHSKTQDIDELSRNTLPEDMEHDKGKCLKSKSLLSQTSYLPNILSSEALHNEMEMELRQLKNLHSLQANQSIYKLAYDESITDQSEVDSRSPSPIDPESQVPSSLTNAEILVHEADSGSEAGSEDVELIPHRYESETFLNENKHVYVNKLSLAVELLRTQESLPYDDEFKRVEEENNHLKNIVPVHTTRGKVNMGFVDDSCSPNRYSITNNSEKKRATICTTPNETIIQYQLKNSANSNSDSAIFSDIDFGTLEDEDLCETATEVEDQENENQDNTDGIRAGYRRFGVQARHYLSPRAALSLNPCFCCIIM